MTESLDTSTPLTERPTEQHYRCPGCKVPRFLAAGGRALQGQLRIKCPKCRTTSVFDLATGAVLKSHPLRSQERELRCGGCRWFVAGVVVTGGSGQVRVQCPKEKCKRANPFACSVEQIAVVELPVG